MAKAGADIIVAHMGVTTGGSIGATSAKTLDDVRRARSTRSPKPRAACGSDVIVLCHGGPIAMPDDAEFVLKRCPRLPRLLRRSSMERLPVEIALTEQTRRFKAIAMRVASPARTGDGIREGGGMAGKFVIAKETKPRSIDWGRLGWLSNPPNTGARQLTVIDVSSRPGQGARFPQAPGPGRGDPRGCRQGRAVGRPREAHPRPRRFRLHPGRRRARLVQCRRPAGQDRRHPRAVRREIGYELVDVAGEAPWKTLRK